MAESAGHPNVIAARKSSDEAPLDLYLDPDTQSLRVNLWVYDTELTSWVRMIQPNVSDSEGILPRDQRFDYTSGDLDYKGINEAHNAATSTTSWKIWKYTWSGTDLVRLEGPLDGSWDNRAALSWG